MTQSADDQKRLGEIVEALQYIDTLSGMGEEGLQELIDDCKFLLSHIEALVAEIKQSDDDARRYKESWTDGRNVISKLREELALERAYGKQLRDAAEPILFDNPNFSDDASVQLKVSTIIAAEDLANQHVKYVTLRQLRALAAAYREGGE